MDAGNQGSTRKFPSYTLRELEEILSVVTDPGLYDALSKEIAARKSGASKPFRVPQI